MISVHRQFQAKVTSKEWGQVLQHLNTSPYMQVRDSIFILVWTQTYNRVGRSVK